MTILHRIVSIWRNIFKRRHAERELSEEIRVYLELLVERKIEHGVSPDEARRLSMIELGGTDQVKERVREVRMGHYLETILQDIRYAVKMLLKKPAFTAAAMIALALGIGANTAIFSLVHALLLNPLPFPNTERLVMVYESVPGPGLDHIALTPADFVDLRKGNRSFVDIAACRSWAANLTSDDTPQRLIGQFFTVNMLDVLGAKPAMGRSFLPEDGEDGKDDVVIINHGLWQSRFASDPNIIGKKIAINGIDRTIIGVMPDSFNFPTSVEVFAPLVLAPDVIANRRQHRWWTVARLKSDVSINQARADLTTFYKQLESQYPATNTDRGSDALFLLDVTVKTYRRSLLLVMGSVAFVLLIGCANVGNLMLARATGRVKEIAVRSALGASRLRIMRQLLTESIILALSGAAIGVLIGSWSLSLLKSAVPADYSFNISNWDGIGLNLSVLAFTFSISILTSILFGLAPALQISRPDLNEALKDSSGKTTAGAARHRFRDALIVAEVALSLMLLIGGGLMLKSFYSLIKTDSGLKSDSVLTMGLTLPYTKYADGSAEAAFFKELTRRVNTLPGVESAGVVSELPMGGGDDGANIAVEGLPEPLPGHEISVGYQICTPGYFQALGITFMKGRAFTEQDERNSQQVVIINETLAKQYWPNEDAVGNRLRFAGALDTHPWKTIVGVVKDVKIRLQDEVKPEMYTPYSQDEWNWGTLVVHTKVDPKSLSNAIRAEVASIDKTEPVYSVKTMDEVVSQSVFIQRFSVYLLGFFAALALVLAAVGIYGVMSYSVGERTNEIGIRMALGASSIDVLKMVIGRGLIVTMIGIGIGLVGAIAVTKTMTSLLFGVGQFDVTTFGGVSMLVIVVSFFACYVPARRATKIDPMVALRYE